MVGKVRVQRQWLRVLPPDLPSTGGRPLPDFSRELSRIAFPPRNFLGGLFAGRTDRDGRSAARIPCLLAWFPMPPSGRTDRKIRHRESRKYRMQDAMRAWIKVSQGGGLEHSLEAAHDATRVRDLFSASTLCLRTHPDRTRKPQQRESSRN